MDFLKAELIYLIILHTKKKICNACKWKNIYISSNPKE